MNKPPMLFPVEVPAASVDGGTPTVAPTEHQEKLLSYGRRIESIIADCTVELVHEKASPEVSVTDQVAQLTAVNSVLKLQAKELSQRNLEIALISRMNDFLQTSANEVEAYAVITEAVMKLFPDDSGAVFVLNASRDMLETTLAWGAIQAPHLVFPPVDCWAQRRGQSHGVLGREQRCAHVIADGHMYVCLPLLAQGETLGILHLVDGMARNDEADEPRMVEK